MLNKKEKMTIEELSKRLSAIENQLKVETKVEEKPIAKAVPTKGAKKTKAVKSEPKATEPKVEKTTRKSESLRPEDIPQQVYFNKLIKDGEELKQVLCRGYIKEIDGVEYGVAYKSYPKGKKDYAKGKDCWDIVVKDWGISVAKCSHLDEVEEALSEIKVRVAEIKADKKQVKKYVEQFNKAPMLA